MSNGGCVISKVDVELLITHYLLLITYYPLNIYRNNDTKLLYFSDGFDADGCF